MSPHILLRGRQPLIICPARAPPRHPLDAQERAWNRLVSRHRVIVEHSIGGMKRYHAVAGVYRNRKPKTDVRFNLPAAGLWNYFINCPRRTPTRPVRYSTASAGGVIGDSPSPTPARSVRYSTRGLFSLFGGQGSRDENEKKMLPIVFPLAGGTGWGTYHWACPPPRP